MKPKKVLLGITIQVHRIAGDPKVRRRIHEELSDKDSYTHSFVFRQFLRTLIKDLAYIHRVVGTLKEAADGRVALGSLERFLAQGGGHFSIRSARRERYVTAAILDEFSQTRIPHLELLRFLEMTAQRWIEDFFEIPTSDGGTLYLEGERFLTELDDSPDELEGWVQNHHPIPIPPPFPIGAAEFLHRHRNQVRRVEEEATSVSKARGRDDSLLKILDQLKDENGEYDFLGKLKQNTRGNWVLGDLLIALETPSDMEIYTTDKHYDFLCQALGKRRYQGYLPHQDNS